MTRANYLLILGIFSAILPLSAIADAPGEEVAVGPKDTVVSNYSFNGGGQGIENAPREKVSKAVAHYARARSLLIAAINEFDAGDKFANAYAILESKAWRSTLIERARELERVTDPQPQAHRGGIAFGADTRLLDGASKN